MKITRTLRFDDNSFDSFNNLLILDNAIDYLIKSKRFEEPLFSSQQQVVMKGFLLPF